MTDKLNKEADVGNQPPAIPSIADAYNYLVKAMREGTEDEVLNAKEALKKAYSAIGKEAEFEARCKEAEAEAAKPIVPVAKSSGEYVYVKMTKEQAMEIKSELEKKAMENNPIVKSLTGMIEKLSKQVDTLQKEISNRRAIHKSYMGTDVETIDKVANEFGKSAKGIKSERELSEAFKNAMLDAFGNK